MFPDGFKEEITELFQKKISKRNKFAFVVSEFKGMVRKMIIILSFS